MNIYKKLQEDIFTAAADITQKNTKIKEMPILLESSKDLSSYDIATNAAMIIAKATGKNAIELANLLKDKLSNISYIANIKVAAPGFINFTIKDYKWQNYLETVLNGNYKQQYSNIGNNERVNIEYVSANPTGPLHIGHARGAVYGDVLSKLLEKVGYQVTREYYVNDAGLQIDDLARSAYLRYKQAITSQTIDIPKGLYPGEYLVPIGKKLAKKYNKTLLTLSEKEYITIIRNFTVEEMLKLIKKDLTLIDVKHDIFFSEKNLHDTGNIKKIIDNLIKKNLVYNGKLTKPKGQNTSNWESRNQLLFKSSLYNDDQDRPLQKEDGQWTYFASDIAYADDKIKRGFKNIILVLGADHIGYVKRIQAIIQALGEKEKIKLTIKICQIVNFLKNGAAIKMSKRSGSFTTVKDVYEAVGKDVVRFLMLTRKNDVILDFDLIKLKEQSKENPVFYVQYAYVRAGSIIRNAKCNANTAYEIFNSKKVKFNLLSTIEELNLMKNLAMWPKTVESSVKYFEPHRIAFYLQNLAARFHSLWNFKKSNIDYKFIVPQNDELTAARIALAAAVREILSEGFKIIGITCTEVM